MHVSSFGGKGIPALRGNIKRIASLCNYLFSQFRLGHITDHADLLIENQLVIVLWGDREEEFVVFAAAERTGGRVQFELEGSLSGLLRDGDLVLIEDAAEVALAANMQNFR